MQGCRFVAEKSRRSKEERLWRCRHNTESGGQEIDCNTIQAVARQTEHAGERRQGVYKCTIKPLSHESKKQRLSKYWAPCDSFPRLLLLSPLPHQPSPPPFFTSSFHLISTLPFPLPPLLSPLHPRPRLANILIPRHTEPQGCMGPLPRIPHPYPGPHTHILHPCPLLQMHVAAV